jgi:hypothetical protein
MLAAGFEPTIPASKQLQTNAVTARLLEAAAAATAIIIIIIIIIIFQNRQHSRTFL